MRIWNNPIDLILKAFEKNYPDTAEQIKEIEFAEVDEGFAVTQFNRDGIRIYISPELENEQPITLEIATELLAHELAHAICGEQAGHGRQWELTFEKLNQLYYKEIERLKDKKENPPTAKKLADLTAKEIADICQQATNNFSQTECPKDCPLYTGVELKGKERGRLITYSCKSHKLYVKNHPDEEIDLSND